MRTGGRRAATILTGLAMSVGLLTATVGTASAADPEPKAATSAPSTIRYGDSNWSVVCLQQGLNYLAWTTAGQVLPAGSVDGKFGQKTLSAVRSLQVFSKRRVTGVVDKTTGDDLARNLWYGQEAQNIRDWLTYCQHTIPRYYNYPVV
ncbi:peptidoglycan-binding protein [Solirubrobacter taibaiensis]|nr:peptidoglycan-binding protein [Solirubrobacter taibaiensis]